MSQNVKEGRRECRGGGGGVGEKSTVTFYGGKNDVITYTGEENGTVTLNETGTVTATLKNGLYVFTSGISGLKLIKSFYTDTTARLRPERFIYWYGVRGASITHSGTGGISYGATSFTLYTSGDNWSYAESGIDCSQDTKLSVACGNVTLVSSYSRMEYGSKDINLAKNATASLTFTYSASNKPTLRIFDYQNRYDSAVIKEWYLGNRETG